MSADDAPRPRRGHEGRSRRAPSLLSALAGAALLVVLGFALGVVGGLVMEEPDLLLDYVLGRTEQVAVGGEAPAPGPDVAARPPAPAAAEASTEASGEGAGSEGGQGALAEPEAAAAEPAPEPVEAAPAAPAREAPPTVASAPPASGFAVQVGAFADSAAAEQLARRLRASGHPVYIAPSAGADTARWRVRVGPLASRAEAEGVAARLEREERVSTWVLAESPP